MTEQKKQKQSRYNLVYSKDCLKCGNPMAMFWCPECCSNMETRQCGICGRKNNWIDEEYHEDCQ